MEVLFHAKFDSGLDSAIAISDGSMLAAATADGAVQIVNGSDGSVMGRADEEVHDDPPNVMAFASREWLVTFSDEAQARCLKVDQMDLVHPHVVAEPAEEGKRPRCAAIDHGLILDGGGAYVAAASRLIHTCRVPDGQLEHAVHMPSPVRAMCAAPTGEEHSFLGWAYAVAGAGGVHLVSRTGEMVRELTTQRTLRSLGACGPWVAGGTMEGSVDVWDVVSERHAGSNPTAALQSFCGSDGNYLAWCEDGTGLLGLAVSGKRAAVFDFSGANQPHPYRSKTIRPAAAGEPDRVPRLCMGDASERVAWSPRADRERVTDGSSAPTELATVHEGGIVRVWQPHGPAIIKRGGNGSPHAPEQMKPQFYSFAQRDAVHPSGEAAKACALLWLREDVVAVGYFKGDIVAWRVRR